MRPYKEQAKHGHFQNILKREFKGLEKATPLLLKSLLLNDS